MDSSEFFDILYDIPPESWPSEGSHGSNRLDEKFWLNYCTRLDCLDELILAGFMSSGDLFLLWGWFGKYLHLTVFDGDDSRNSLYEQNHSSASDIMFNKNLPRKLMKIDLIRIQDVYGIIFSHKVIWISWTITFSFSVVTR